VSGDRFQGQRIVVARRINHAGLDLALGHRDVAHVDGGRAAGSADRRRSYRVLMRRHGLQASARVITGGFTEVAGKAAAEGLLSSGRLPTAIIAFNDRCAVGLMFELRRAGLAVPGDMSIVGYDDVSMAALPFIDLTTVGQDARATASSAVDCAVARLDRDGLAGNDVLTSPYLVKRSTSGRVPGSHGRSVIAEGVSRVRSENQKNYPERT
jgi:DNA-binding LacI/PurR family transcriptional regulator